jgi:hypothetical protein
MAKVHVTAKKDFLNTLTSARPITAISELIWNGFDAESDKVEIYIDTNGINGIETIRIRDYGYGIENSLVDSYFGNLGESWKKKAIRQNGRSLHGKNGKGRFRAFSLGSIVEWNTSYRDEKSGKIYKYVIKGKSDSIDDFETSDIVEDGVIGTGTEVVISNIKSDFGVLLKETPKLELTRLFAAYLSENPSLSIYYNGDRINPELVQDKISNYDIGEIQLSNGDVTNVSVTIIEWRIPTDRALHLCDEDGVALQEIQAGQQIRAPGFNFTAYIKSSFFRELDSTGSLCIEDLNPDVASILKAARNKICEHFRKRLNEDKSKIVERWKNEKVYPYDEKMQVNPVEQVERQVFDILAVNVENYLPSFEESDTKSKKFTFKLLAQAIKENPESVQTIISEVLGLKKEAQDDLAQLLQKTRLSSIISAAKIVANRLDFITGLQNLLFDSESKKALLERDQLHKILEREAWILSEDFALAGSEERLEEVLNKHLNLLGKRSDDDSSVLLSDGRTGRIDLMLKKVIQPRAGVYEYLVVELKRPSKKIDDDVVVQIKKYARAVASDERFAGVPAKWTFMAISNEFDDYAKREANQRNKPKGQISDESDSDVTVWIKTWAEVINDAQARLKFYHDQLAYEADRDSAKNYLNLTHEKYIPKFDNNTNIPTQ